MVRLLYETYKEYVRLVSVSSSPMQLMGSLEEVHMPQNGINHAGVTALATAMQHNVGLRVLNLNDNTFTKKGAIAMAQVWQERGQKSNIKSLALAYQAIRPYLIKMPPTGPETFTQRPGDQLWRLPGAFRRSHRHRRNCVGGTSYPQGKGFTPHCRSTSVAVITHNPMVIFRFHCVLCLKCLPTGQGCIPLKSITKQMIFFR